MEFGPQHWDERFGASELPYGEEPSLFLVELADRLPVRGRALAPGDGGGRHGVWLAARGLDTTSLDYSPIALQRAREFAARRRVTLHTLQADVETWTWPEASFDVVVSVYLHLQPPIRRRVHAAMLRSLQPGGWVVLEAFHVEQMAFTSGGPRDPVLLYTEELLRDDFHDAELVELRKDRVNLDEGPLHRGEGVLVRLAARRRK